MVAAMTFICFLIAGAIAVFVIGWAARGARLNEGSKYPAGVPDLLMYASMVDDGIMLLQDGGLMAAWKYSGPDLGSATHEEMSALAERMNNTMKLGSGWLIQCDGIRTAVNGYAKPGAFSNPVTSLIDDERRAQFMAEGRHYESEYYLTLTYLPPLQSQEKWLGFLFKGGDDKKATTAEKALATFKDRAGMFEDLLGSIVKIDRLRDKPVRDEDGIDTKWMHSELCRFLRRCVTGEDHPFTLPEIPVFMHDVIGNTTLTTGVEPVIGDKHLQIVAIDNFPNTSFPGILAALDTLPFEYRWNTRAILMDPEEAKKHTDFASKKWMSIARGFINQLTGKEPKRPDVDALKMHTDSIVATGEASSGEVLFAHYSGNILLMDEDLAAVKDRAREISKLLRNLGFGARIETFNSVEAWRGSLPGDGYRNKRRVILHTLNLADCMPIAAVWSGDKYNPCPFFPRQSEPLMYSTSTGSTVFRLNFHVGDLGHTLIVSPSGTGKSTLLGASAAQFDRYENSKIFFFDKDYSSWALCQAASGEFYDLLGEDSGMCFAPFAELDTPGDMAWASEYVEQLCVLAGIKVEPEDRKQIWNALQLLSHSETRTFTELLVNLQSMRLRDTLRVYTLEGALGGLLEAPANKSILGSGKFKVFEMNRLMGMNDDKAVCATLLYLFRYISKQLDGSPVLIIVDEAWKALGHPLFCAYIEDWSRTLRKFNASLIITTQNLSDISSSNMKTVLKNNCLNKIFGPNPQAMSPDIRKEYEDFELNAREIKMLSQAIPKRQYYQRTPNGRRLFELGFGKVALSFIGVNGPEVRAEINKIRAVFGDDWIAEWLRRRNVGGGWAEYFEKKYRAKKAA